MDDRWSEIKTHTHIITTDPLPLWPARVFFFYLLLHVVHFMPICGNFEPICAGIPGLLWLNVSEIINHFSSLECSMRNPFSLCSSDAVFSTASVHWSVQHTDWITPQLDDKTLGCEGQGGGYFYWVLPRVTMGTGLLWHLNSGQCGQIVYILEL